MDSEGFFEKHAVEFFEKHAIELPKLVQDTLGYKISTKVSEEIGDGNLNEVYRVGLKSEGTIIVKYAPPYVKVICNGRRYCWVHNNFI